MLNHISHVWPFATLWNVAHQDPLLVGFSRLEYWVAMPSSRISSRLRDWTHISYVSCTTSATEEALAILSARLFSLLPSEFSFKWSEILQWPQVLFI